MQTCIATPARQAPPIPMAELAASEKLASGVSNSLREANIWQTETLTVDSWQGNDYMHARYYSPNLGRFLSVDPVGGSVGSSQSWNRYSYSLNNPLKYVDPNGEDIELFVRNDAGGGIGNWGHVGVRVFGDGYDRTFDYSRQGNGIFNAPGLLRVWSDADAFRSRMRRYGDLRTVEFDTTIEQDEAVMGFFDEMLESAGIIQEYKDRIEYDVSSERAWSLFGGDNCASIALESMSNARDSSGRGVPGFSAISGVRAPNTLYDLLLTVYGSDLYPATRTKYKEEPHQPPKKKPGKDDPNEH